MNQIDTVTLYTETEYLKACDTFSQSGFNARFYNSSELAACDVIQSLIQFMPHKTKIAIISKGSHLLETVVSVALRNQNQIIYKKDNESTTAFIEQLDSSVHCVYWATEHEVTGDVFYSKKDYTEILGILNRKKIYSVQITSGLIPQTLKEIFANEMTSYALILNTPNIFDYRTVPTMLFYSDKQKIQFALSTLQNSPALIQYVYQSLHEFNQGVSKNFYSDSLQDRVVITTEKVSAMVIKQSLNLNSTQAFVATEYASWVTDLWLLWWPEISQLDILKNTLVLSKKYTDANPNYLIAIKNAEDQLTEKSTWNI